MRLFRLRRSSRGWAELKSIDQSFHFIFGPADYRDRYRIAVVQHGKSRLTKNSRSNVFVEVFAHQVFCAHRNLIGLFVGREALVPWRSQ